MDLEERLLQLALAALERNTLGLLPLHPCLQFPLVESLGLDKYTGFRVQSSGFGIRGLVCRVLDLGFGVWS